MHCEPTDFPQGSLFRTTIAALATGTARTAAEARLGRTLAPQLFHGCLHLNRHAVEEGDT